MTNVDLIKQGYSDFASGNVEAVLAIYDPVIEWRSCTGFPYVVGDVVYTGIEAIVTNVFMKIPLPK